MTSPGVTSWSSRFCRKVGTGGGAPSESTAEGVGLGVGFGFVERGEVRFCALVLKALGITNIAARVNSSTTARNLLLLMQII